MKTWNPGINHIEFWVSDLTRSLAFYRTVFGIIGWKPVGERAFSSGHVEIYFTERQVRKADTVGPRHICLQATSRDVVDSIAIFLNECDATIIRGPVEVPEYSQGYYTIDFRDPDGYVLEVAYTPSMEL
jgi:catechol 2,3-dioxygenase-like lactoylglutathione lyase family enzyme